LENQSLAALLRIRLIAGIVAVLGVLLAMPFGFGAALLHQQALVTAALVALIASMLANAIANGWRAFVLLSSETWTSLGGKLVSRSQQPSKYWLWLTVHLVLASLWTGGAGLLVGSTHFLRP
jgi:uncharacterized membrane protein